MDVKQIDKKIAQDIVIKNHYLHRKASCCIAFGAYVDEELIGVCMFGIPASPSVCIGLCGPKEKDRVLELTRLWIDDKIQNYPESTLISKSLKLLRQSEYKDKDIIISYADSEQQHLGVIYQATNWIYLGMSDKHIQYKVEGISGHSRHYFDEFGGIEKAKIILGNKMIAYERPRKYRYLYINTKCRIRRKEILSELRYRVQFYPKHILHRNFNIDIIEIYDALKVE